MQHRSFTYAVWRDQLHACIIECSNCIVALLANVDAADGAMRCVMTALGHGQRAMPEDAFKPAEMQASMHDSVASQAKGGEPVAADTISVLHNMSFTGSWHLTARFTWEACCCIACKVRCCATMANWNYALL